MRHNSLSNYCLNFS